MNLIITLLAFSAVLWCRPRRLQCYHTDATTRACSPAPMLPRVHVDLLSFRCVPQLPPPLESGAGAPFAAER